MLNREDDRELLLRLGLTLEDLERLRGWTTFDDPKENLTEEIVRLAKEDFRKALAAKVTGDPSSEDDKLIPVIAPKYLAFETAHLNRLISSRLPKRLNALAALAMLLLGGLGIGYFLVGLPLATLQRETPQRTAHEVVRATDGEEIVARRRFSVIQSTTASPALETLLLNKTNEIPISSEPEGATVVIEGTEPIEIGTTPFLLEVYSTEDQVPYVTTKSLGGKPGSLLLRFESPTVELKFKAPQRVPVSREVDFRTAEPIQVDMVPSISPDR